MKQEKAVIIKTPILIKIRNSLRYAIHQSKVSSGMRAIDQSMIIEKKIQNAKEVNNESERKRLLVLAETMNNEAQILIRAFNESICYCSTCRSLESDMKYSKRDECWYCVKCFDDVHFDSDLSNLNLSKIKIKIFLNRLAGSEGCQFDGFKSRCGGKDFIYARKILNLMGISKEDQDLFLKFCKAYGGYCDCEILMNAASHLLNEESPW